MSHLSDVQSKLEQLRLSHTEGAKARCAIFLFVKKKAILTTFRTFLDIKKNEIAKIGSYLHELNCPALSAHLTYS